MESTGTTNVGGGATNLSPQIIISTISEDPRTIRAEFKSVRKN